MFLVRRQTLPGPYSDHGSGRDGPGKLFPPGRGSSDRKIRLQASSNEGMWFTIVFE